MLGKSKTLLVDLINALECGQFVISLHALSRMRERNIDFSDIEEVIFRAIREENKDSLSLDGEKWKYAVRGKNDRENKELRLVVMYLDKPKMLLVTAIDLL